ncbi:cupin domain-containing protein [Kordiimonas aestuarii]|uniref:cupin n=1 Tax=Kordiimonas aestuarii TaxID=1005925 RepID=UPI0021CFFE73|nr:cupin [Kordiimonas aestuarii]
MQFITPHSFTADRAWDALDIAEIEGASVRLHWTDTPYKWHVNDGDEVFVVLTGVVDMHYRDADGRKQVQTMAPGDIYHAGAGDAHVAHPQGAARVLVVEKRGSV